jgi:hypothetical protein
VEWIERLRGSAVGLEVGPLIYVDNTMQFVASRNMPKKTDSRSLIPLEVIERRIFVLRGHRVMLDRDLVKRNGDRYPQDFMFTLSMDEAATVLASRSQIVTF